MRDVKDYALKKPCCSLERETLNTTGALRVLVEKHACWEIKSALGTAVLQVGTIFQCCCSIKIQPVVKWSDFVPLFSLNHT